MIREMTGLELATTQELIDELLGRETFRGLVMNIDGKHSRRDEDGREIFTISRARLTVGDALLLLDSAAETIVQSAIERGEIPL